MGTKHNKMRMVKYKRSGAFILEDGGRPMITVDEAHDIEIIGNINEANVAHGTNEESEDRNTMNTGNTMNADSEVEW